jgi:peptidoglycan hydrolase-like protein with peptidoglycan-binding domain
MSNTACLAHSFGGACFNVQSPSTGLSIGGSVGASGANRTADVRLIQGALNMIPPGNGGANPALAVDGLSGPKTVAAITKFQGGHTTVVDGRVDPNGPTLQALDMELGGAVVPVAASGTPPATAPRASARQAPDPQIVGMIVSLLPKVRAVIRAARFRLTAAGPFVTNKKQTLPTGLGLGVARDSLTLLDQVFDFFKFANPQPVFENLRTVYGNMDVALNRSFETDLLIAPVLFVANTSIKMEKVASAYTSAGGAFVGPKVKFDFGDPANRIYLCSNLTTASERFLVSTVVHELAHYVSNQSILIVDPVGKGFMDVPADKPAFDKISPAKKIRSAEHYAFFALSAGSTVKLPG